CDGAVPDRAPPLATARPGWHPGPAGRRVLAAGRFRAAASRARPGRARIRTRPRSRAWPRSGTRRRRERTHGRHGRSARRTAGRCRMTAPGAAPAPPVTGTPVLEGRSLVKHFPVHRRGRRIQRGAVVHAVDDVSIAVPEASITAVVGESGCGKSTLTRMLARLIRPTAGELLLNGSPAAHQNARAYAGQVQMVLQDPFASLNLVHTVGYHLARPLRIHGLGPDGTGLDDEIASLLERVALSPQNAGKYPYELSGGQRQRVAIARALAVRPRVLLADEPVSMLDVSIRLGVLNLLADLREREGMTILYITHDIASARYLADEIAVMYAGRLVESAPAISVTDRPAHPYTQPLLTAAPDPDPPEPAPVPGRATVPRL